MTETPGSPSATRLATPGWLDTRLVLGVLLVLVSVVVGARVLSTADRSQLVWAASGDLAPGSQLRSEDLEQRRVRLFDNAGSYLRADQGAPTGYVVRRGIGRGELVPLAALARPEADVDFRLVTVPVAPNVLPPGLRANTQVDVYVTPSGEGAAGSAAAQPEAPTDPSPADPQSGSPDAAEQPAAPGVPLTGAQVVLLAVTVVNVGSEGGFGSAGGSASVPVVLQVRPQDVARVVSAMSVGRIDLVRVPQEAEVQPLTPAEPETAG